MTDLSNRKTLLLAAVVCIHIAHTVAGVPVEGIEQTLIAIAQGE